MEWARQSSAGRAVALLIAAIVVAVAIGLAVLWPGDSELELNSPVPDQVEAAEITRIEQLPCPGGEGACSTIEVALEDPPPGAPRAGTIEIGTVGANPDFEVGDSVRVLVAAGGPSGEPTLSFVDFERRGPIAVLAIAFVAIVLLVGRLRGGLSLLGLVLSLAIVLTFVVPAIGKGEAPLAVALVGALAVMLVTIAMAHGVGAKSAAAILGTTASLLLVVGLASAFTELAHLTGFASEEANLLSAGGGVSIEGLLLAGMVIGALGVLDDVTVSQSSTVMALRASNPSLGTGELFRRATEVGRDHISATVNTLVLAYAGAALPVLLVFSAAGTGFGEAVNTEIVATEVVAMLVGSIGLIAAVPVTTGLAALLASRLPAETLSAEGGGHVH